MNRLTPEEAATIKSMGRYWEEVVKRPGGSGEILAQELNRVYSILGLKLLWIMLDHARQIPASDEGK